MSSIVIYNASIEFVIIAARLIIKLWWDALKW